jgi:hypothetical protein|tara:strand:- start:54 stop:782 length:729 start_codon:yes stop_codon:yes gene_type:complete
LKIEFISVHADFINHPVPIKKQTPEWFKKINTYINKDLNNPTLKKCVPFLDAMTMGYAIKLPVDICFTKKINKKNGNKEIDVKVGKDTDYFYKMNIGCEHHNSFQFDDDMVYPDEIPIAFKFLNPWMIKTPPGYSCIITSPFNTEKRDVRIVTGIVDTDEWKRFINFTFFLQDWDEIKNPNKIISKETTIALVFPFKKENWEMKIKNNLLFTQKKYKIFDWNFKSFFHDNYKKLVWNKKNYR